MPQFCSHCSAETADGSRQCPRCGQTQEASAPQNTQTEQGPQTESDKRFPFWTILPWTLLAAAILFLLPPLLRSSHAQKLVSAASQSSADVPRMNASSPTADKTATPLVPDAAPVPITAAEVPLTVTLSSAGGGKHVPVGTPVMISAYASLPPGQSATLAISYSKEGSSKTLLALAQGSLASAAWTPTAPGRYWFTASALDSRKNGAFSRHLTILVDAPPPVPIAAKPEAAEPAATKRTAARRTAARPIAPHIVTAKHTAPRPSLPKPRVKIAAAPQPYHVAAAGFSVKRVAVTLAGALRRRGFNAFVRPSADGQHPKTYRVETGDFVHRADAQKQMQLLQRDGYPSYVFQAR